MNRAQEWIKGGRPPSDLYEREKFITMKMPGVSYGDLGKVQKRHGPEPVMRMFHRRLREGSLKAADFPALVSNMAANLKHSPYEMADKIVEASRKGVPVARAIELQAALLKRVPNLRPAEHPIVRLAKLKTDKGRENLMAKLEEESKAKTAKPVKSAKRAGAKTRAASAKSLKARKPTASRSSKAKSRRKPRPRK